MHLSPLEMTDFNLAGNPPLSTEVSAEGGMLGANASQVNRRRPAEGMKLTGISLLREAATRCPNWGGIGSFDSPGPPSNRL
jgi:hypothetical protein